MTLDFGDLAAGMRLSGVVADADVTVVAVEMHGDRSAVVTYRAGDGRLGERIVLVDDLAALAEVPERRWSFDADGAMFRLASEARRMSQAHLADPFAAVDTSNIDPYPHQIDAVYNRLLAQRPLRFLLADDPGAGKTIMSGLLVRELVLRGDVARCLIVAPGSLVEQWQDELWDKFGLSFELMSRAAVEASRAGNPFTEKNLLIARVDQLSRSEELMAKVRASDWDLVIVDEAHKMSAHRYGDELRRTKRFVLGEALRECTRHLLLLTATPHNGKNEDFLAFMTLIDPERFAGRLRDGSSGGGSDGEGPAMPDVSDVMRRLVKENLRTFEGRRLFPQRHAHSLNFELSEPESALYEAVTKYVSEGMNRAARMREEGEASRGIIVGFALAGLQRRLASSPAAVYHSLRRRRDRLAEQAAELRRLAASGDPVPVIDLPKGVRIADLDDFDFDDYGDAEREDLEDFVIDAATAAGTAEELDAEVAELQELVRLADGVRRSGIDTKWLELRDLLRSDRFAAPAPSPSGPPDAAVEPVRKLIVFSEHKDTLDYVAERIESELGRPEAVVRIHGGIKRHDRRAVQDRFRVDPDGAGAGGHRRRRRGRQPAGGQHGGQLRPAVEPQPHRAALRAGAPHRPAAAVPSVEPGRPPHPGGQGVRAPVRQDRGAARRVRRPGVRRAGRRPDQHVAAGPADAGHRLRRRSRPCRMDGRGDRRRHRPPDAGRARRAGAGGRAGRPDRQRQDPPRHGGRPGPPAAALVRGVVLRRGAALVRRAHRRARARPFRDHPGAGRGPGLRGGRPGAGARPL